MKAISIPQHELSFRQTGIDSSGTQFILTDETVNITDKSGGKLTLVDCRRQIPDDSYFLSQEQPKERIVLHYTAGYLKGDIAQLSRRGTEVSVPFVIGRSGLIYNLWKSFASFNQKSSLSTWMYRVAMNVAIYHLKITKRKISTIPLDGENFDFTDVKNTDYEDELKTFGLYLNNLNQLDKGIVMLYLENKSYAEIAEIIGISESNVGTKMSRIKEKLKKQIVNTNY